jgi:UDP-N-acetylmuramoyl-L-alanyl-D-glutamate--2,6-diaminopimelate ligase
MAKVAARLSDFVIITSDNPRSEDPLAIIEQIIQGLPPDCKHLVEPDRRRAIELAIGMAKKGDCVLLAGKGHETYQILRDRTIHFDDREVAREVLRQLN